MIDVISGGCGFVGKNMVRKLVELNDKSLIIIDDLSVGQHPDEWLSVEKISSNQQIEVYQHKSQFIYFLQADFRDVLYALSKNNTYLHDLIGLEFDGFADVFHFAAIVGGRAKIDGDPMTVALDLAIDAQFFKWVCDEKPQRVLYPSSSAAYPVDLQREVGAIALKETDIDFDAMGKPDMTYGWSKLTGEFLAQIAAAHYGLHVTCIRPFSGYGEDQDLTYPIPAIARRAARKEDPFEVWGTGKQGRDFVHIDDVISAPITQGQELGNVVIALDDEELLNLPIVSAASIEEAGFFSRMLDSIQLFFGGFFSVK